MKKVIAVLLVVIMLFSFTACGEEELYLVWQSGSNIGKKLYSGTTFGQGNNPCIFKVYYGDKQLTASEYKFEITSYEGNPIGCVGIDRVTGLFECTNPTSKGIFYIDITYKTHVLHTGWDIDDLD